ncbi:caspase family protein [Mesorhizobium sp. M1006]|uniref:caspase family protein n=1 Tax=Mesorhizobium sp. M1006 TaxID=2957048 RepID=UPI0033365A8E
MSSRSAKASSFSRSRYAVVVGANGVKHDWLPALLSPSHDAETVALALSDGAGCAIPSEQVELLAGPAAVRDAVIKSLRSIVAGLPEGASLFFYFAGHGLDDGDDFYLLTSDAEKDRLAETALSGRDLQAILFGSRADGIFFVVDCGEGGSAADRAPAVFRNLPRGGYRVLLASTRPGQQSWERADGRGTHFSSALVKILKGEIVAGDGTGAIYFADLVKALDSAVAESTALHPGFKRPRR